MKLERRSFLKTGLLLGAGFAVGAKPRSSRAQVAPVGAPPYGLPVIQLFTDSTSAQFRVLSNPLRPVEFEITNASGRTLPFSILSTTPNPFDETEAIDHLLIDGLQVGKEYLLKAFDLITGAQVEERIFSALDVNRPNGRIAIVSCMLDILDGAQAKMWKALAQAKPDAIILGGDTCYGDLVPELDQVFRLATPKNLWRRHCDTRRTLDCFAWKRLIPMFATWDDHDYGGNNSDRHKPYAAESLQIFKAMFGWKPRGLSAEGPGVSTAFDLFGQRFLLLDDRFFRDKASIAGGMHWGSQQERWMIDHTKHSRKPVWLVNGSQFYGSSSEGVLKNHPEQFQRVLGEISQASSPVLFASGDVHFSEVMKIESKQIGYETLEVTSSSIHSVTYPGQNTRSRNRRRIVSAWQHNFVLLETNSTIQGKLDLGIRAVGGDSRNLFSHSTSVRRT